MDALERRRVNDWNRDAKEIHCQSGSESQAKASTSTPAPLLITSVSGDVATAGWTRFPPVPRPVRGRDGQGQRTRSACGTESSMSSPAAGTEEEWTALINKWQTRLHRLGPWHMK
jgi:hypothetical protein